MDLWGKQKTNLMNLMFVNTVHDFPVLIETILPFILNSTHVKVYTLQH